MCYFCSGLGEKGVPHSCVVCKSSVESYMHSRPLMRTQVAQYGLSESDVQAGDRVCNTCRRCKSVRHRYKPSKQCPIPTCPAKKARVKRLRPFPAIWKDLSDEKRDAIMAKYQIPPTATKCCTACFNRINRRLSPNASLDTPDDPGSDTTRWTDDEIETMKKTLVEYGTDWRKLSEKINTKSDLQCRNFYFNFRKKYGLDALVQEYKKSKGGDGPPTLTDEEESGSTTSSCDETVAPSHDQSPRSSSNKNKDDYDSSATVSAEEGGAEAPEKPPNNPVTEMRSMPINPSSPLSLTVRHQQPAPERNQGPPPPSRIQSVAQQHQHNQENGQQQVTGAISLVSSHHSIIPPPQPPHSTMSSHHPQHPLHSPQITASLALQQRSSPNIQVHPSQQQQHPTYPTAVISHGSQINHHNQGQPQGIHHLNLHQARGVRYPSPEGPDGQEPPISVRVDDLMSATIERHLRRNPTASTSLNSGSLPPRDDCGTLDLSMKKRPASPNLPHQRPPSNGPPPAHQPLDYASRGPQGPPGDMYYAQKFQNAQRHPIQQQQPPQRQQAQLVPPPPKQAKVPPLPGTHH
ncbi:Nuclear receptor corepressor 1 [Orchesella cincta]|uniref:Nuclear receptor corepressor 1 n=1 Tax=Orchesella cincta TaxID=48709 RepID=A0A1D2NBN6_ORCCI|nr:Nuclear receptor corepressor 1 [Orchesella cincta]